jgi:hypothetical protein
VCPNCGAPLPEPEAKEITVGDGELRELTASDKAEIRANLRREQSEARTLADLVKLGQSRGYKAPQQWAYKIWTARGRAA